MYTELGKAKLFSFRGVLIRGVPLYMHAIIPGVVHVGTALSQVPEL